MITKGLEPQDVLYYFEQISGIPRPSGKEEAIGDYLIAFAKEHDLEYHRDAANNVILIQEASPGRESDPPILLQGHMDMVCEKESGCTKDMDKEGLDLALDGDWLYAEGTTLGGDDGIAVAMMLALLSDPALSHPRLECVITTEEETGMDGAHALDPSPLRGRQLLNIDSEEEGILTVGCAGGEGFCVHLPLTFEEAEGIRVRITLDDLTGGHSGIEIHRNRANADLLLLRVLRMLQADMPIRLCDIRGGSKNNAIPRTSEATLLVDDASVLAERLSSIESVLRTEYAVTDPELKLFCAPDETGTAGEGAASAGDGRNRAKALTADCLHTVFTLFAALPNGVERMDQHLPEQTETSLNLGILYMENDELYAEYLMRSSLASRMEELDARMALIVDALGGTVTRGDQFPAWEYVADSPLRDKMIRLFREQYQKDPVVETVHAGLECGLLAEKLPGLDAVSIGPNLIGIHTPEEKMSISSVQRVYHYVRTIIEDRA